MEDTEKGERDARPQDREKARIASRKPSFWGLLSALAFLVAGATLASLLGRLWWILDVAGSFRVQYGKAANGPHQAEPRQFPGRPFTRAEPRAVYRLLKSHMMSDSRTLSTMHVVTGK